MSEEKAESVTVLVFIALPEEHDRFLEFFPAEEAIADSQFVYVRHKTEVSGVSLLSVLAAGMGIDNAFDATSAAIQRFRPNIVVCVGIAGSLTGDLRLGDVSVANEVIDISQNMKISEVPAAVRKKTSSRRRKSPTSTMKTVVELSPKPFVIQADLAASFRFLRSHPTLKADLAAWSDAAARRRDELIGGSGNPDLADDLAQAPVAEIGPIISGPVVASSAFKDTLKRIDRKVLSVETESSGVYRASFAADIPCITVRGISDHADINKNALERTTKQAARQLASDNAITYFALALKNQSFLRIGASHLQKASQPQLFSSPEGEPDALLRRVSADLSGYLEKMSPEYKHRPNNATLPIPRVSREMVDEDIDDVQAKMPKHVFESLETNRALYVKIPKSFPNQTLAWSVGQALLRGEIDGKQVLPLVVAGEEVIPPSKGIQHATGIDPLDERIARDFTPVIVISEPVFHSEPKTNFLISEIQKYAGVPVIVISRAELPTDQIDRLKTDLGLVDHVTAPVPFAEIAAYLETAFAMKPAEADSVATRLDDTFSKFRLHTHPAYFIGLQEATIDALIEANHRAELIQLAVDGLLSFVVAFDESSVKLGRTTREEFLTEVAFLTKVEKKPFSKDALYGFVREFGERKALEVQPDEFLRGYFAVGLLNEANGSVSFSLPYLEAYLLSERLRGDPAAATRYFDPTQVEFDQFTFDLYIERGACPEVVSAVCDFAKTALETCDSEENVFIGKRVKPRALATPQMLLQLAQQLGHATERMTENSGTGEVRQEKQRLLDARATVRGRVASRDPLAHGELPDKTKAEFERLDKLSRASTLLATIIGSGAERLDGPVKEQVGNLLLNVMERFLHYWTVNRMTINFDEMRDELKSDDAVKAILDDVGVYDENIEDVRESMILFLDDQELRLLSGPAGVLFMRLAQYAGVRSLRPTFSKLKPDNKIQKLLRDVWLMDVEHNDGKRALKETLQTYKGSPLLRLVVTNHLMNRIFWHHWQRESRASFVDVARYSLAPLGLKPADEHTRKMLSGPKR